METKVFQVEIINVQRVTDIVTGQTVIQVGFGTPSQITPEIEKRIRTDANVPTEVYTNVIQLMLPMEGSERYTVGSKWVFKIGKDGSVNIHKVEE